MKNTADLRKENKNIIRSIMRDGQHYTKQQIAELTGLSVATCNTLLNEMSENNEVLNEKIRLSEVGRTSASYYLNEQAEKYLCLWFEEILHVKYLNIYLLSPLGKSLEELQLSYESFDQDIFIEEVRKVINHQENIKQIVVGVPATVEDGILKHCDIEELNGMDISAIFMKEFSIPTEIENDMHYRILGYYKEKCSADDIVTLANFPSHILPGTASIHQGKMIGGYSGLAGMVGFLPFDFDRKTQIELLDKNNGISIIVKSVVSIIALINPNKIVFTGDLIDKELLRKIEMKCLDYIPVEHMPEFYFERDTNHFYLQGMYQKAIESRDKQRK